jgi:hypothetical protein
MAGMVILVGTTPMFWTCLLLVPFTTLMPDITLMAINVTAFTSETDKIRLAEHARVDPEGYISDSKPDYGSRAQPKIKINRTISNSAEIDEMEMTRGYAFSQEEGGAISQTEYIRRKSLYPRPRRGSSARDSGNIGLVLYGNYSREEIKSEVPVSATGNYVILHTIPNQKTSIFGCMSKSGETYTINDEETMPLKSEKYA